MRFFSKLVFLCNCCFLAVVVFRSIETEGEKNVHAGEQALTFQPLVSTIAILGYGAIIFNLIFNIISIFFLLAKKPQPVAKWLVWVNFLFLLAQVYYLKLY
jgi:hypothetical protein